MSDEEKKKKEPREEDDPIPGWTPIYAHSENPFIGEALGKAFSTPMASAMQYSIPITQGYSIPTTQVVPIDDVKAYAEDLIDKAKKAESAGEKTLTLPERSMQQDMELRKTVAKGSVWLFGSMNVAAIALVTLNGFGITNLSDKVLIALLTATVAEIAALMMIIARYLFPNDPTKAYAIPVPVETREQKTTSPRKKP